MDFCQGKPHVGEKPEQLEAIEQNWEKWYEDDKNCQFEIHDSPWLERCIEKVTGGKTNLKWFVPLCEKSPAMKWLWDRGDDVIGVELVGKAIERFFHTYDINYTKSVIPHLEYGCLYQSEDKRIKIFKCNIFDVTQDLIGGPVDAIWERGSMQDVDQHERPRYGEILLSILKPDGSILAETFEVIDDSTTSVRTHDHEQDQHGDGASQEHTPHSVNASDFERLYGVRCTMEVLAEEYWGTDYKVVAKTQPYSYTNTIRLIKLK